MRKKRNIQLAGAVLAVALLLSGAAFARPVWVKGEVTKAPYRVDGTYYMQVDGDTYRILPDARIASRYSPRPGAYNERKAFLSSIIKHQEVSIRVNYNEILRIVIQ